MYSTSVTPKAFRQYNMTRGTKLKKHFDENEPLKKY